MTGSIRNTSFLINKLLRDNVTLVQNRVYPPGLREDAKYPRISVHCITPGETFAGLGAGIPVWKNIMFRLAIWDENPIMVDRVAEQVEDTIANNRNYRQTTVTITDSFGGKSTVNSNGYFCQLKITGGTETLFNSSNNRYYRTINVGGLWMQTA